jgi:hypothetical protein
VEEHYNVRYQRSSWVRTTARRRLRPFSRSSKIRRRTTHGQHAIAFYHLKASLEGHAGHVLWEITPEASESDIIKLLRNRFGNVNQMEGFRAEIRSRRRKAGETVQSVYQDIRRLMALGFPGQTGELCEIIARDFFLDALVNPTLRIRVLDPQPRTLDDALTIVSRMEAYSGSASGNSTQYDDETRRRKAQGVNIAPSPNVCPAVPTMDDRRFQKLDDATASQQKEIRQLRSDATVWKERAEGAAAAAAQLAATVQKAPPFTQH